METLEHLLERIDAHRNVSDLEKFTSAIEPALNMGIRDFLTRMVDDHVVDVIGEIDTSMLIGILLETDLVDDEILTQASRLNDAVRSARRTILVRSLREKFGDKFEGVHKESEQTLDNADQYLNEAEEFIETLLEIAQEN